MSKRTSNGVLATIIILAVIIIDQTVKVWVKTSFYWGEDMEILPFFHLRFVQNPGMAFGWQLGSKIFLTLFRIVAVAALIWYLVRLHRLKGFPKGYVTCVALIAAGAAGNIFDCLFYGEIFTNPAPPAVATFVPWGQGYGKLFEGMVVDMLYFPLFSFTWPDWLPMLGDREFSFFDPVFNVADSAITVGVIAILLFYRKYILVTDQKQIDDINGRNGEHASASDPTDNANNA